jgi:hypothetical protein
MLVRAAAAAAVAGTSPDETVAPAQRQHRVDALLEPPACWRLQHYSRQVDSRLFKTAVNVSTIQLHFNQAAAVQDVESLQWLQQDYQQPAVA